MNIANAIEGGLTGATTLTLLQEALHKIDAKSPRPVWNNGKIFKKIKKNAGKSGLKSGKLYIRLAGELLTNAAYFGLAGLGKKKNAVLRGGLLGAAAGLGSAFLDDHKDKKDHKNGSDVNGSHSAYDDNDLKQKILTIGLYTAGGLLAGMAVKKINKKSKKKK